MPRVTVDTNVYISALNFGGMPERLLMFAAVGAVRLLVSDAILEEVGRVLRSEKFRWSEAEIDRALFQFARIAEHVETKETLTGTTADPSDSRILECADADRADFIISGDKHLLTLKQHRQAPISKVADFLRQLQSV